MLGAVDATFDASHRLWRESTMQVSAAPTFIGSPTHTSRQVEDAPGGSRNLRVSVMALLRILSSIISEDMNLCTAVKHGRDE